MPESRQIIYMQVRIMSLTAERYNYTYDRIADLFDQYGVMSYIENWFSIFSIEGDEAVLDDVKNS